MNLEKILKKIEREVIRGKRPMQQANDLGYLALLLQNRSENILIEAKIVEPK